MQVITTIDEKFYKELGEKMRKIRKHRNMTLEEVAKEIGISRPLLDHWELGFNKVRPKQLDRWCKALNISNNLKVEVSIGFLGDA